jgi:hypothetical protein
MRIRQLRALRPTATGISAVVVACVLAGVQASAGQADASNSHARRVVNCDAGQSINQALRRAEPGATIVVRGTCRERVVITQPVTLDGGGSAVIDGGAVATRAQQPVLPEFDGVVVIDGVTGVALLGLTVQNGASNGIVAAHGAAVILHDDTTQNNVFTGIVVSDNSTAEAIDSSTRSNGVAGFDVFTSSSLILRGTFVTSGNGVNGGEINGTSIVELRGAQVTVADHLGIGIIAGSRSHLAVFGFPSSSGSTLNVSGSGFAGIGIADSTFTIFSDTTLTATNNGVGLLVASGHLSAPGESATFVLHDNGVGLNLFAGSSTFLRAGFNVHDNGTGILVDDASLSIAAPPGLPNSITGNGTDVQLSFGARTNFPSGVDAFIGSPKPSGEMARGGPSRTSCR